MNRPGATGVDPDRFRGMMARWATGVSVVTASAGGRDAGLTVNAFLSVSLDPPSVLVSLMRGTDTLPFVEASRAFGVSVLAADQRALSERFARTISPEEKFERVATHRGTTGVPLLDGTLGALECRLVSVTPVFDHHLVVGEVVRLESGADRDPLVYFRSSYAVTDGDGRLRLPPKPP